MILHLIPGMSLKNICIVLHNLQSNLMNSMYAIYIWQNQIRLSRRGNHITNEGNEVLRDKTIKIHASKHGKNETGILVL